MNMVKQYAGVYGVISLSPILITVMLWFVQLLRYDNTTATVLLHSPLQHTDIAYVLPA